MRVGRARWFAIFDVLVLALYGVVHTCQRSNYGRIQVAYSGCFRGLALVRGWRIDEVVPDRYGVIGAAIALVGVSVTVF